MSAIFSNVINAQHPLGKGEVVSSILTGSTTNPRQFGVSDVPQNPHPAVSGRTAREHDKSNRGKPVESVRSLFVINDDRTALRRGRSIVIQTLSDARTLLRSRMKSEPEAYRPLIRNVIANLNAIDSGPPDQRAAAKLQLERNIAMLERVRREDVA